MLDLIENGIVFCTWLLFAASFFYGPMKNRVDRFIATLLLFEYTFWPVFYWLFPAELPDGSWSTFNEVLTYIVSFFIYSAVAYLLVIRNYPYIALGYIAGILVVMANLICVTFGGLQWFWDNYQLLMVLIMAYIVLMALHGAGYGGKRVRDINSPSAIRRISNHWASVVYDLAKVAW